MVEPFLAAKAFDMSATALGKAVSVVLKGLLVLGVIALMVWSLYVTIVRPHTKPAPTQQAEVINNNYYETKSSFFLGLKLWGFKLGISK